MANNYDFVCNGATDYVLVVPSNLDYYEDFAKKEFVRLFKEATGISIKTCNEEDVSSSKFISLGRTKQFFESGIEALYSELRRDGYKIINKNGSLFLIGGESYGTVYSVYGFFERQFGYRYYIKDEYKLDKKENVQLLDFNVTDIPDIENRTGRFYYSIDKDEAIRQKTLANWGFFHDGRKFFGSFCHTHFEYLPKDKYLYEHKTWYSPEFTQLCLTNKEMWDEMVEQIKIRIVNEPESEYFIIGHEDINTFCGCPRCLRQIKKYGESGVMMRFINYVARKIKKWVEVEHPERHITIVTFAYQRTQNPPVKKDENGNYVPIDKSVIPEDNVSILLALIGADWSKPMNDPIYNEEAKLALDGWSSLTSNLSIWAYAGNFNRAFTYFDNFDTLDENYKICKKYGFTWVYFECNAEKQGESFQAMLNYVHARLAWDTQLKSKDLIDEFMPVYYKEATPYIREYFDSMFNYFSNKKQELNEKTGEYHGTRIWNGAEKDVFCKSFYDFDFLNKMYKLLNDGISVFDSIEKYDSETKKKYQDRVAYERLTIKFLFAEFFYEEIGREKYLKFIDEFEKECDSYGMTWLKLRKTKEQVFEGWRKNVK